MPDRELSFHLRKRCTATTKDEREDDAEARKLVRFSLAVGACAAFACTFRCFSAQRPPRKMEVLLAVAGGLTLPIGGILHAMCWTQRGRGLAADGFTYLQRSRAFVVARDGGWIQSMDEEMGLFELSRFCVKLERIQIVDEMLRIKRSRGQGDEEEGGDSWFVEAMCCTAVLEREIAALERQGQHEAEEDGTDGLQVVTIQGEDLLGQGNRQQWVYIYAAPAASKSNGARHRVAMENMTPNDARSSEGISRIPTEGHDTITHAPYRRQQRAVDDLYRATAAVREAMAKVLKAQVDESTLPARVTSTWDRSCATFFTLKNLVPMRRSSQVYAPGHNVEGTSVGTEHSSGRERRVRAVSSSSTSLEENDPAIRKTVHARNKAREKVAVALETLLKVNEDINEGRIHAAFETRMIHGEEDVRIQEEEYVSHGEQILIFRRAYGNGIRALQGRRGRGRLHLEEEDDRLIMRAVSREEEGRGTAESKSDADLRARRWESPECLNRRRVAAEKEEGCARQEEVRNHHDEARVRHRCFVDSNIKRGLEQYRENERRAEETTSLRQMKKALRGRIRNMAKNSVTNEQAKELHTELEPREDCQCICEAAGFCDETNATGHAQLKREKEISDRRDVNRSGKDKYGALVEGEMRLKDRPSPGARQHEAAATSRNKKGTERNAKHERPDELRMDSKGSDAQDKMCDTSTSRNKVYATLSVTDKQDGVLSANHHKEPRREDNLTGLSKGCRRGVRAKATEVGRENADEHHGGMKCESKLRVELDGKHRHVGSQGRFQQGQVEVARLHDGEEEQEKRENAQRKSLVNGGRARARHHGSKYEPQLGAVSTPVMSIHRTIDTDCHIIPAFGVSSGGGGAGGVNVGPTTFAETYSAEPNPQLGQTQVSSRWVESKEVARSKGLGGGGGSSSIGGGGSSLGGVNNDEGKGRAEDGGYDRCLAVNQQTTLKSFLEDCGCLHHLPTFEQNEMDLESCQLVDDLLLELFGLDEAERRRFRRGLGRPDLESLPTRKETLPASTPTAHVANHRQTRKKKKGKSRVHASECLICMTKNAETMFAPCGHMAVCVGCLPRLKENEPNLCLVCRQKVGVIQRIYRS